MISKSKSWLIVFYQQLFFLEEDEEDMTWYQTNYSLLSLLQDEEQSLESPIDMKEIHDASFSMEPWKAPGPNGYLARFFYHSWKMVKYSLCQTINSLGNNLQEIYKLNKIIFVWSLKWQPQSLLTSSGRFLYVMSPTKFKPRSWLIGLSPSCPILSPPHQSRFIPTHSIYENVVVAWDIKHSMRKMRGKLGYFVIKVDLAKAYGRMK